MRTIRQTQIYKNLFGSAYSVQEIRCLADPDLRPPAAKKSKTKTSRKASGSKSIETPAEEATVASSSTATSTEEPLRALVSETDPNMPAIFSDVAELNLWDWDTQVYDKQGDVVARIVQNLSNGPYDYWLVASSTDGQVLAHKISSEMNQRWATQVLGFTWNYMNQAGVGQSWCLRFETEELYKEFTLAMTRALWEAANELPWSKAKVGIR